MEQQYSREERERAMVQWYAAIGSSTVIEAFVRLQMQANRQAAEIARLEAMHASLDAAADRNMAEVMKVAEEVKAEKDAVYSERDNLVCVLSKLFPSWLERHPYSDTKWEDDWRWIVFVDMPTGQCSWHIHDSERALFRHLELHVGNSWDGHTTEEKYRRLSNLPVGLIEAKDAIIAALAERLREAREAFDDMRDSILNERYAMAEGGYTGDQINDVLSVVDDAWSAWLSVSDAQEVGE